MGHLVIGNRVIHGLGAHRTQADVNARGHRNRPCETPAVAVEHRQRPQIHREASHARRDGVGVAHERRTTMVVDDALGVSRRAAGIIQRNRIPLVLRRRPVEIFISVLDEGLILYVAEHLAILRKLGIIIVNDERLHLGE